ncbi:hypothetical protein C8Q76DRAFT_67227 [Earliella scabrosa]|nr:hypothetical protein C8Q76DRAFT_67227 [Earliella scabrosa]
MSSSRRIPRSFPLRPVYDDHRSAYSTQLDDDHESQPIVLHAQWRGTASSRDHPFATGGLVHVYQSPLQPSLPLWAGLYVRVAALSRLAYHAPNASPTQYESYDPHIIGRVIGVMRTIELEPQAVVVVVENECRKNPVRYAHVVLRHVPGQSVRDVEWKRATRVEPSQAFGTAGVNRCVPQEDSEKIELASLVGRGGQCAGALCMERTTPGSLGLGAGPGCIKLPIPRIRQNESMVTKKRTEPGSDGRGQGV